MTLEIYDTRHALVEAASARIESALKAAIRKNDRAGLILSGGSTPGPVYEHLSTVELDWRKVTVGLADERWVAPDHPASNEKLISETLLKNEALNATLLPMKTRHATAELAVHDLNDRYQTFEGRMDVMVLGMGPDGHSLSWFPEARGLKNAIDPENTNLVADIQARQSPTTGEFTERMTLTARCVKQARHVFLLITGQAKKDVLESSDHNLPIRTVETLAGERLTIMWAA